MLQNVTEMKRDVFVSINHFPYKVSYTSYNQIMEDVIFCTDEIFFEKYNINLTEPVWDLHLVTVFNFKTFDGGKMIVELHKFDGDYWFIYKPVFETTETQIIRDEFEPYWRNDTLCENLIAGL